MKYMVMECHPAYAVLMDEESRFVRAANLHYTVGQTVTDPVLMQDQESKIGISRNAVMRFAAAAACLLLISAVGFGIFSKNRRTNSPAESVVVLVEETRYEMKLNSEGAVIDIQGEDPDQLNKLLEQNGKELPLASVFNSLLQDSIDQGRIDESQTVEIYLSTENAESYTEYKEQLENEAAKLRLNADVKGLDDAAPKPEKEPLKPAEPNKPEPAAPKAPQDNPKPDQPLAPAVPAAPPKTPEEPAAAPPAAHPNEVKPEPPASELKPAEPPAAPEHPEDAPNPPAPHPGDEKPRPEIKPPQPLPNPQHPEAPLPTDEPAPKP